MRLGGNLNRGCVGLGDKRESMIPGDLAEAPWKDSLSRVLALIRTNSASIVDDTSLEKLLTWISCIAGDPKTAKVLVEVDTGILNFLSPPHKTIFESPVSANFAFRLTGIIAGASSDICATLIGNGTLQKMFYSSLKEQSLGLGGHVWVNAAVRNAYFEGLATLLNCKAGYQWTREKDLVRLALDSFNDKSFYIVQSAVKFLSKLLAVSEESEDGSKYLQDIISQISSEFSNCKLSIQHHFLEIVCQLLDVSPHIAIKLLEQLPGISDMLENLKSHTGIIAPMIQAFIELSGKMVNLARSFDFPWHMIFMKKDPSSVQNKVSMIDVFMKLAVHIANIDTRFAINFLVKIICSKDSSLGGVPSYWNELIFRVIIENIISGFEEKQKKNTVSWLRKTLECSKHYPLPEEVFSLLGQLEKIFTQNHTNLQVWKRNFILVLDSYSIFSKDARDSFSVEGMELVEHWGCFLSKILIITSMKADEVDSDISAHLKDVLANRSAVSNKCCVAIKTLLSNGWFSDFSDVAKTEIVQSLHRIISDVSTDTKTLSGCLLALSAVAELPNPSNASILLSGNDHVKDQFGTLTSNIESLLNDERWEVQDSVIEFLVTIIKRSQKDTTFLQFLTNNQFWVKSFDLLDADESYIRASSVRLLSFVIANETLREVFKKTTSLDKLLAKLTTVLQSDDEAFPRRSAMDLILHWLEIPEIRQQISKANITGELSNVDLHKTDEIKIINMIMSALAIAANDFDWEVKMKGIQCWHKILKIVFEGCKDSHLRDGNTSCGSSNINNTQPRNSVRTASNSVDTSSNSSVDNAFDISIFNIICHCGGSSILVKAINDCDQMVREAAFSALVYAKNCILESAHPDGSAHRYEPACSAGTADTDETGRTVRTAHRIEPTHRVAAGCVDESARANEPALIDEPARVDESARVDDPAQTIKIVCPVNSARSDALLIFSCHDIEEKYDSFELKTTNGFSKFLKAVDFVAVGQSLQLADAQVASYPMSLLNDILAASMSSDENLLDCY